mgnify:CR=1 FL=1
MDFELLTTNKMNYTKVLGKCCSVDCSKKSSGKCQSFSVGSTPSICGYCGCHEGAHTFICHLPVAAPLPVPAPPAATPTPPATPVPTTPVVARCNPTLHQRKLQAEERKRIFQAPATPQSAAKKKGKVTKAPAPAVAKVASKPKEVIPDTEENRRRDRAEALLEVPDEDVTGTDLDIAPFWRINRVPWMPEVWDQDPIVDFTKYCFACKSQNERADREVCDKCKRFMFVECGHFGYSEAEDGDDQCVSPDFFRCCDCKDYLFKRTLYLDHLDSLPPRTSDGGASNSTNSRFSNAF